ncbi:hypothetical protein TIFTF001_030073 [Ficus carica]|uniref:Uncharacterized protein n=1 Tax=Ficus carica TaxID=3494 RepID=A0AA88DSP8_FICCA|nr:hypothetical protein TIFTF001_030073 [Ficus carica]
MVDLFMKQAKQYADNQPDYPKELFEFIASKTPSTTLSGTSAPEVVKLRNLFEFSVSE